MLRTTRANETNTFRSNPVCTRIHSRIKPAGGNNRHTTTKRTVLRYQGFAGILDIVASSAGDSQRDDPATRGKSRRCEESGTASRFASG